MNRKRLRMLIRLWWLHQINHNSIACADLGNSITNELDYLFNAY